MQTFDRQNKKPPYSKVFWKLRKTSKTKNATTN